MTKLTSASAALAVLLAVVAWRGFPPGHLTFLSLVALAALAAVVIVGGRWAFLPQRRMSANRVRYQRVRLALHLHPGKGHATAFQLRYRWGHWAAFRKSSRIRPTLGRVHRLVGTASHAVYLGTAQLGIRVWLSLQENVVIIAPPRTGKTGWLAKTVLHAPGPVITGSTRADVYELTHAVRRLPAARTRLQRWLGFPAGQPGEIHVFNPQGVGDVPSTFRWNPVSGCDDPQVAARRADAFIYGGTQSTGNEEEKFWLAKASMGLRACLVAAALQGADFEYVARCVSTGQFAGAIKALEQNDHEQLAWSLTELLPNGAAARTSASVRMFMSKAVGFMTDRKLAQAVKPDPAHPEIDFWQFLTGRNTIYLITESSNTEAPLASLTVALVDEVHHQAVQLGSAMPGGRLDPPCVFALDEVAQTVPVPLREWMAWGSGVGLPCHVVIHGVAQLRSRYGDDNARSILDTAGCWLLMGGINDDDTLKMVERLCGEVALPEHGNDAHARHPVISVDQVRELPEGKALLVRGNLAPVIVRLPMAWKDREYKRTQRALKRAPEFTALPMPIEHEAIEPAHLADDGPDSPWWVTD